MKKIICILLLAATVQADPLKPPPFGQPLEFTAPKLSHGLIDPFGNNVPRPLAPTHDDVVQLQTAWFQSDVIEKLQLLMKDVSSLRQEVRRLRNAGIDCRDKS